MSNRANNDRGLEAQRIQGAETDDIQSQAGGIQHAADDIQGTATGVALSQRVPMAVALAIIFMIIAGSAYALATGTIFQHAPEGSATIQECGSGSCSDCEDAEFNLGAQPGQVQGGAQNGGYQSGR